MSVLAWTLDVSPTAERQLAKLDRQVATRILSAMEEVAALDDPRSRGKGLTGPLRGMWRYRIGDWRVICDLDDGRLLLLVAEVGHRSDVYVRRWAS